MESGKVVGALLTGVAVGAVLGALLTSEKGKDLIKKIVELEDRDRLNVYLNQGS